MIGGGEEYRTGSQKKELQGTDAPGLNEPFRRSTGLNDCFPLVDRPASVATTQAIFGVPRRSVTGPRRGRGAMWRKRTVAGGSWGRKTHRA